MWESVCDVPCVFFFFFFQAEDGIRDYKVTGVQTCALPILDGGSGIRLRLVHPGAARTDCPKWPPSSARMHKAEPYATLKHDASIPSTAPGSRRLPGPNARRTERGPYRARRHGSRPAQRAAYARPSG